MPRGLSHRAWTGIAAGLTLAFLVLVAAPAQADQIRHSEWWLRALHVTTAWDATRGSGVTIAVLDTGVDPAQPDLSGSVITGRDYTNSGRAPGGPFWGIHGTEVASLIAGHGHGAKQADGIIGIAPSAKILSVRVTLESNDPQLANPAIAGALPSAIAHGIRWAVRHGASVIDLPLDPVTTTGAAGAGPSAAERAAVAYALSKHVVLVAPAGDEGATTNAVNYPAAYHGVIAVGAFGQGFVRAPFSSHRPYVTVTAAGAGVTAANPSSLPANAYTQLNSTSAASAVVAGIAALIRAQFPDLTPAQVTRALTTGTVFRHGGRRDGAGFGSVDAAKALTKAAGIAEAPSPAASGAAPSPPTRPVMHNSPIHRNIRSKLAMDAAIAGAVFLLLLGLIFTVRAWRRRHARTARLAEVRAATQVPARKPGTAKKGTAKKGPPKKGPVKKSPATKGKAKKGTAKNGAPTAPPAPAVVGGQAPEAAPELQPTGFIPAPLSPAMPRSASPTFGGSASPTFGGSASPSFGRSASTGFAGSSGFGGSSSPGFTGSSGFTGSAMSGSAGPASSVFTGSASPGFGGSARSGVAGSASPGFTGSASSGFAAAPTPPTGPGASANFGGTAGPGSPDVPPADTASPADLATPVDPASSPSQETTATTRANEPPWAPIPSEPRGLATDTAGAAIPGSAFPAAAGAAASGTAAALGAGQNPMGIRRPHTAAHRPAPARIAQVSGRPPWEPAPRPDSELPWAQASVPPQGGTGSLPKPEQTRPALPSWDALAEDVWPGGPRSAALHRPVSPPSDLNAGGLAGRGSTGVPAMGAMPPGRPVPAVGLTPPQPAAPGRARSAEERPGNKRKPDTGATPFRAAQSEPAPPAERIGRPGAGSGFPPASKPAKGTASPPADSAASAPDIATASPATDTAASLAPRAAPSPAPRAAASPPGSATATPASGTAASPPDSATATPATGTAASATASPATGTAASPPDSAAAISPPDPAATQATGTAASPAPRAAPSPPANATANPPTDASASEPPAPLPRRLSTPPLRPPNAFPPSQPGTDSSLFRSAGQPPFPPAPRPATEAGAAGAWQPSAGAASFPPTRKQAPGTPASGASATDVPASGSPATEAPVPGAPAPDATAADGQATDATAAEPGLPDAGKTPPGRLRVTGGPASAPEPAGPGTAFPRAARLSAGDARPTSGVPPWEITDSFLAVPPASAGTAPAGAKPKTPRPLGGPPSAGTAGAGDSTEIFPAIDPAAEQRSFSRADPGDGNDTFPAPRPRTDEEAFRLFPPVRRAGDQPPAPPATDDQD